MKKLSSIVLTLMAAVAFASVTSAESLMAGDAVETFTLANYDGSMHSLEQYSDSAATVVLFVATQCPVSNDYNERMVSLATEYGPKGFAFVGINSNKQESVEEIAEHAGANGFPFPVLDDEGNVIADRFGATRTPEVYVINPEGMIVYHGRIDDSRNADRIESRDLASALDAILAGSPIDPAETKAFGCTIKRVN